MSTRLIAWNGRGTPPYPVIPWNGTPQEKEALNRALEFGFDGTALSDPAEGAMCRDGKPACHVHMHTETGQVYAFHLCGGHDFLCEVDEPGRTLEWTGIAGPHYVTGQIGATLHRTDRLLYARRIRSKLLAEEGLLQQCEHCKAMYLDVRHQCEAPPDKEDKFPW